MRNNKILAGVIITVVAGAITYSTIKAVKLRKEAEKLDTTENE